MIKSVFICVLILFFSLNSTAVCEGSLQNNETRQSGIEVSTVKDVRNAQDFFQYLQEIQTANPELAMKLQKELLRFVIKLNNEDNLQPLLSELVVIARKQGLIPEKLPQEMDEQLVFQLASMIEAELQARGLTEETKGTKYKTWAELSKTLTDQANGFLKPFWNLERHWSSENFQGEFSQLFDLSYPYRGHSTRLLVDGPMAFEARRKHIKEAKDFIHLLSWAIYDDVTGQETFDLLSEKVKEGVKVRVMVDGLTAMRPNYHKTLDMMEEVGIEVIRWRSPDPKKEFLGQHRKVLIIDGQVMITGGMNHGDVYSHRGSKSKWRDTDIEIIGPVLNQAQTLFRDLWNKQRGIFKSPNTTPVEKVVSSQFSSGSEKVFFIEHNPVETYEDPIYLSTLIAIKMAKKSIDIENAYVILTPAIEQELKYAIERGVRVRVLSNSPESVDEPIVTVPILKSLKKLKELGAEIYLRKGSTLHSKFLIVDDLHGWIGSYNLHPRSLRYEGESVVYLAGVKSMAPLVRAFLKDIKPDVATKVENANDIQVPDSFLQQIGYSLFFDQL